MPMWCTYKGGHMNQRPIEYLAAADPHIVRLFADHLVRAYEQFIHDYPGTVDYIDGLMAAHNFHKAIVGHLVEETGQTIWWNIASTTFSEAVEKAVKQ